MISLIRYEKLSRNRMEWKKIPSSYSLEQFKKKKKKFSYISMNTVMLKRLKLNFRYNIIIEIPFSSRPKRDYSFRKYELRENRKHVQIAYYLNLN